MKTFTVGKRKIGTLDRGVFSKEVTKSRHLFRTLDAWAIDAKTLNSLPEGTEIRIHDIEEDVTYITLREHFIERGEYYHFKEPRKDHRTQLFLKRCFFMQEKPLPLSEDERAKLEYLKIIGLIGI